MANAVDIFRNLFRLQNCDVAVLIVEALQLQIEIDIDDEIERLIAEDTFTAEEWCFVDAGLHVMSGIFLFLFFFRRHIAIWRRGFQT